MKVVSVNIGEPVIINWNGKKVQTGIFKKPVDHPILLEEKDVKEDTVSDRRYHGGIDKACYLYSADYYDYWKNKYPDLDWSYGMLGENITLEGLEENKIKVGEQYQLGSAIIQISQPRQPCYKLGVKFNSQKVLREFIDFGHPGTYVRVLAPGTVSPGDHMLLKKESSGLSISDVFLNMYK